MLLQQSLRSCTKLYLDQSVRINVYFQVGQQDEYSFTREKVRELFYELMENDLLTLPDQRRYKELGRNEDPKYVPYHQLVSYAVKDCFVLKKIYKISHSQLISLFSNLVKALTNQVPWKKPQKR